MMTQILCGIMIVVTVWAVMAIRASGMETKFERARADELLQQLIQMGGENRVLTDQARYYKAIGDKFLNQPVMALINDEQIARLSATITQGLATSIGKVN